MSEQEAAQAIFEATRVGALIGIGIGVVLTLIVIDAIKAFKAWQRSLERQRQVRGLRVRSMRDWRDD